MDKYLHSQNINTSASQPTGVETRDEKSPSLARDCCIMTNIGALCLMHCKLSVDVASGDRQTEKQHGLMTFHKAAHRIKRLLRL